MSKQLCACNRLRDFFIGRVGIRACSLVEQSIVAERYVLRHPARVSVRTHPRDGDPRRAECRALRA